MLFKGSRLAYRPLVIKEREAPLDGFSYQWRSFMYQLADIFQNGLRNSGDFAM